jgi:hypothetical protein
MCVCVCMSMYGDYTYFPTLGQFDVIYSLQQQNRTAAKRAYIYIYIHTHTHEKANHPSIHPIAYESFLSGGSIVHEHNNNNNIGTYILYLYVSYNIFFLF